jgi:hypothetical protein
MAYTIQRQASRLGPYDLGQVRVLAQSGEVSGADLVWREGSPIPTTVAQLLQTAEHAQATATSLGERASDAVSPAPAPESGPVSDSEPEASEPGVDDAFVSPPGSAAVFKKGPALTSFYLAAVGLIPVLGLFCAVPAIFFGLRGLHETKNQPQSRERMHALVGVFVGGFLTLMYALGITLFVMKGMRPGSD